MRFVVFAALLACGSTPVRTSVEPQASQADDASELDNGNASRSEGRAADDGASQDELIECTRVADTWVVERGTTCIVGIDTSRIRAYPSCGSEFVEVYFSADMQLLIRGMQVGCYLWQYIDRDGEPQSAEFCVGPDIGTGRPCGY